LWTEEQTATLSLGVFSVLLGNGINPTGTASTESRPALDTIFTPSNATSRFLEITVDNGDNAINASDVPISPRQQITSTAFALHAKVADGIASGADLTINPLSGTASNYGLGWYGSGGTGRLFDSVAVDGPVLYGNSGGALGSSASGTKKIALLWNATGQVGIGATASASFAASNKLTLQGDDAATPAQQLVIRGNTDPAERLNIGFDTTGNKASLQSYTAAATLGNLLLNPSGGNVGIGSAMAPNAKLSIGDPLEGLALSNSFVTNAGTLGYVANSELILGNFGYYGTNNTSLAISAYRATAGTNWFDTAVILGMNVDNTRRAGGFISIHGNGNVGIGDAAPGFKLSVNGNAYVSGNLHANGNIYMKSGDHLLNGNGPLHLTTGTAQPTVFINNWTESMRITATGNVGIGTTAPGAKLQIADGGDDPTNYGSVQIIRHHTGHLGSHLSFIRAATNTMGLGYGQSSSSFGFGPGTTGAFSPTSLSIDTAGSVGIGNVSPLGKFTVNSGNPAVTIGSGDPATGAWIRNDGGATVFSTNVGDMYFGFSGNAKNLHFMGGGGTDAMTVKSSGNVHIGTGSAVGRLNVGALAAATVPSYGYFNGSGAGGLDRLTLAQSVSIYADGTILSYEFNISSDLRIKTDLHAADSGKDLGTLMGIEVTDYHYKDKLAHGNGPQKKVIAQQVEKVYPQAVNITKGVVPDIYQKAGTKDGWVELATDLKVGDRVRLISEKEEGVHEVLEVKAGRFLTQFKPAGDQVFVYGREVNDFRSVDYDAIAMLNVSATQELARQLKEKDAKIAVLEAQVAAQDKRSTAQADEVASQNSRLVALEKLMNQAGGPETVSIKLGDP
jgi:hypothetical protein